jgi:glycosyltransferase involved in cell wall biosynthesis
MNEASNLPHVLGLLPEGIDEVILVDGNSTDDTVAVARSLRPDVVVVRQTGRGKGNALACGFSAATSDIIVMIDADASMDPCEIPAMVETVAECSATYAKGSRHIEPGGSDDLTAMRRLGNRLLLALVNCIYRTHYTDLCYGLIAFWRRDLEVLGFEGGFQASGGELRRHESMGFEVETLLNVRAAKVGLRVVEVPSYERARLYGTSNLRVVRDGLRVLRTIVVERFRPVPARSMRPTFALDTYTLSL